MLHLRTSLVALALLACAAPFARAEEARPAHELTLGASNSYFATFFDTTPARWMVDVAYHRAIEPRSVPLRLTGGVRATAPGREPIPLELYARAELVASLGAWTPALGPELGLTGLTRYYRRIEPYPNDLTDVAQDRLGPVYVALNAAPLRFVFGRWTVSAVELQLGAPLGAFASVSRFQLGLLRFGATR